MDHLKKIKISFNSPVILAFVLVSFLALILDFVTGGLSNQYLFSVYRSSVLSPLTYIRLVLHVFGHADWVHFFGNMTLILLLGPLLEEKYGKTSIISVILSTAVVTGILNMLLFPNVGLLGASGVVFAFIILASMTSFEEGTIPLTFILVTVIYIGEEVYNGIFVQDNISNLTHIMGGVVGAVCGNLLNRKRR